MFQHIYKLGLPYYKQSQYKFEKKEILQIKSYLKKWENFIYKIEDIKIIWTGSDQILKSK